MNKQLSPIWKRTTSSARLSEISAQFLSEDTKTSAETSNRRIIPFLIHSPELEWVTHDLCVVLSERGHSSFLCHLDEAEGKLQQPYFNSEIDCDADTREYCLLPVTSAHTVVAQGFDHLVLVVPANLDAVRIAYQQIKLITTEITGKAPEIGIVIVGPRDQHAAWRFFRKLAVGTLRYLDTPLLNLGFLPAQVTPEFGPADHHRTNFLARISERLIRTQCFGECTQESVEKVT